MKRYRVDEISGEHDQVYLFTIRDTKTRVDVLFPTQNKYEAINMCEYLNAKANQRRKPNKPTREQYVRMIPI